MAARLFNLMLCALLLELSSLAAKAITRSENRVGGSPVFSSDFASQESAKPIAASGQNAPCGYDFASGTHKYLYAQDDPVNMVDPSGHDGDLVELMTTMAINSGLSAMVSPVISYTFKHVGFSLLPPWVTQAMKNDVSFDAFLFGASASYNIPVGKYPIGIAPVGGIDLLVSPWTKKAALYGFGSLTFNLGGGQSRSPAGSGTFGFVFNTPSSDKYTQYFITESIPYKYFPPYIKSKFDRFLASGFGAAFTGTSSEAVQEWKNIAGTVSGVLDRGTANVFYDPTGGGSWGVSFSYAVGPPTATSGTPSFSGSYFWQLLPRHGQKVNFR